MAINVEDIKKLRELTGSGVVEAKNALEEAKGDFKKAEIALRKKGFDKAKKKTDRTANQGIVEVYNHLGRIGSMVELACETDFVARNDLFKQVAHDLTLQIASMSPKDIEDLLAQNFIKDESITIADLIRNTVVKTGENICIKRFSRFQLGE